MLPQHSTATADLIHALATAIRALPLLSDFRLGNMLKPTPALPSSTEDAPALHPSTACAHDGLTGRPPRRPLKRLRISPATEPLSLDPVVAALAASPALLSLAIHSAERGTAIDAPMRGIAGRFAALEHLHLEFRSIPQAGVRSCAQPWVAAPVRLSLLPALTSLSLVYETPHAEPGFLVDLVDTAAVQPRLVRLDMDLHVPDSALQPSRPRPPCAGLACLTALQLRVAACDVLSAAGVRAAAACLAMCPALLSLGLWIGDIEDSGSADVDDAGRPWPLLRSLTALSRLQRLSLAYAFPHEYTVGAVSTGLLRTPLRTFSGLTALAFDAEDDEVAAAELALQLPWLQGLSDLRVCGLRHAQVSDVRACLAPLTGLTWLALSAYAVDGEFVKCVARCAGGMPHLEVVSLDSCTLDNALGGYQYAARNWIDGLVFLPAWGRYRIQCRNDRISDAEYAAVRGLLVARGAAVTRCCEEVEF